MTEPFRPEDMKILGFNVTEGFVAALAEFQSDIPVIERDRDVEVETKGDKANYSYSYATLAHVTRQVLPRLGKLGLAWTALPTLGGDMKPVLRFALMHKSGGYVSGEYPLRGEGGYQAIGSAITYVRRYCLQAVTGVAAEEDDDAARADEEQRQTGQTVARRRGAEARQNQAAANTERVRRGRATAGQATEDPTPAEDRPTRANPDAPVTSGEQRKLFAQLRDIAPEYAEKGDAARAFRLNALSDLVGRELGSINDLTSGQAGELIETLDVVIAAGPTVDERRDAMQAARVAARSASAAGPAGGADAEWQAELDQARQDQADQNRQA